MCILSYQVFWLEREDKEVMNEMLIALLATTAVVLCMTFPFKLHSGFIYDLRLVPILLCFLFGGIRSIAFTGLVYLSYRYFLGGDGFISSLVIYLLLCLIVGSLYFFTPTLFKTKKKILGIGLMIIYSLFLFIAVTLHEQTIAQSMNTRFIDFFPTHFFMNIVTMALSLYLIDGMLEKRRLKEKVRRTEKMLILGELSASFAHEMRNPLTAVRGFTQVLMDHPITEEKRKDYLQIMMNQLQHAESILIEYAKLTKSQVKSKEPIDLNSLIDEAIEAVTPIARDNHVQIRCDLQQYVSIEADPQKIKDCLINIMENGIEAMPGGGELLISLKRERKDVVIDIIDSGVGMTMEEIKRYGYPFYSTKEKGTGLGSMVAYSIIKELNGDLEIMSKKGEGTRLSIMIPDPVWKK
ncbi:ATP-binding protein [Brevibacillus sp. NRS-1366]|uniref:ATP-binding protein n=1 Tax=Brevibacillus sp. NRS-1366 TaxID=3233899 RepID=UPI003D24CEEE